MGGWRWAAWGLHGRIKPHLEPQAGGQSAGNADGVQAPSSLQEEGVEIEYVPAPLDLDIPGIKTEAPAGDAPMPEVPGLGSVLDVKQEGEETGTEVRALVLVRTWSRGERGGDAIGA